MRAYIYYNLRTGLWSVRACEGEQRGRVIAHLENACLLDCTAKVSEKARQRVIANRRREVHAGIEGTLAELPTDRAGFEPFSYNPYKAATFYTTAGQPFWRAEACLFAGRAALVKGAI